MSDPTEILPGPVRERLAALDREQAEIEEQLVSPAVLADHRRVRDLSIRKAANEPIVDGYRALKRLEAAQDEYSAALDGDDKELAELAKAELPDLRAMIEEVAEQLKSHLVTAEERRVGSVILEIRAGTGGEEAGLWARDLLEMYTRYASGRGWQTESLDITADGDGIRHATVAIAGEGVWAELGFEGGVHAVKRVPATESQGRIHTSTATVAVLPEPEEVEVQIDWNDVEEFVTTAQGPGGQNVNKVATAVTLIHRPTGIEVRMQESKSQHQNRAKAKRLLLARLHELERARAHEERAAARNAQIGQADRAQRVRTYRYQEGIVVDQRIDQKFPLREILAGDLHALTEALLERETARRLADL